MTKAMRHTAILASALFGMLTLSTPGFAARIDSSEVIVRPAFTGYEIANKQASLTKIFEFDAFTANKKKEVPGFSDPLGTGSDPEFKVFSGAVENLDLLGDFHPSNPYDPQDLEPTQESLETAQVINDILYTIQIPEKESLVSKQLDVKKSQDSLYSVKPRTSESSPLILAGFGSVSEVAIPLRIHWTHCPDFTRYLHKKPENVRPKPGSQRKPGAFCFMI